MKRSCLRCKQPFAPSHSEQYWCQADCYWADKIEAIGVKAAGMQPLSLFGDTKKIQAFNRSNKCQSVK